MLVEDLDKSERIRKNVRYRIEEQIQFFGHLPERNTIAWGGYLAALFEKGLLDYPHYRELIGLLPKLTMPNPVDDIFIFDPGSAESQYVRE